MTEFVVDPDHGATIRELGLRTTGTTDGMVGVAAVTPHLCVPGTGVVRTSILATWADVVTGLLSNRTTSPRIAVTLDLDVHLLHQPVGAREVTLVASVVKAGRSVVVCSVEMRANDDALPFGVGHATFMASPNPAHVAPGGFPDEMPGRRGVLSCPVAERAGVRSLGDGTVEIPLVADNLNATGALQGGLLGLAAEQAVLDQAPSCVVTSMALRYLRAVRVGPGVAAATVHNSLARVEVHDAGSGKVSTIGTFVLAPAAG